MLKNVSKKLHLNEIIIYINDEDIIIKNIMELYYLNNKKIFIKTLNNDLSYIIADNNELDKILNENNITSDNLYSYFITNNILNNYSIYIN
jgi:hypothetical protein